ncbi:putative peptidyl-prolyl cis-trans isomerase fkbp2-like protein [Monocercomonoides exilis]|uniref:putative peptidyl-prolyl cis-trans isomerase fkbp2-like protein n=1 Tax=Monocercomonoides exilis TaxID=2049356 RepID=UPI00355A4BBE|nr:putative peptidyl-prolyl cis-trans isomerase fkbp2-like protein [Monocercomonoides exilis]|eukprot:MONOS_9695.1-p1 / transcript=MONOS_9695.1 / gene=MONOS_9695 / organism=Monocercomonoides_exilis_PA203 / gene_product=peptidyl-prolyl cis-trans isomerase fkbp2-like protein / transcript_product=peptidyl-prolyl cis-trans isomerase fkbp2-like protein / location=Mono_scaffold00410:23967-24822(-) / protein_length=208 / sequence_SO=supercontig / SO=protein_coding / is_pseudo=false
MVKRSINSGMIHILLLLVFLNRNLFCETSIYDLVEKELSEKPPKQLIVETIEEGEECEMLTKKGHKVKVHYTGRLYGDDEIFDNSYERKQPFEFVLGFGQVVEAWDEGLLDMCVGEKRRLIVPPSKGYGRRGVPDLIPGSATLVYEIELVSFDYTKIHKRKTAAERIEERRKAEKKAIQRQKLQGELQPDGSRLVNYKSTGEEEVIEL